MHIVHDSLLKRCQDGSDIREIVLSDTACRRFIAHLGIFGEVTTLDDPDAPFFCFERKGIYSVKGMEGDRIVHVRFRKGDDDRSLSDFSGIIMQFELATQMPARPYHYSPADPG